MCRAVPAGPHSCESSSSAHRLNRCGLLSPASDSRKVVSAETGTLLSWLMAWVRDLTADFFASLSSRSSSTGPSLVFAAAVARPPQHSAGRRFRVDGVGLAASSARCLVRLVHLGHLDALGAQVTGRAWRHRSRCTPPRPGAGRVLRAWALARSA
jgi:hypothetical protein